MALADEFDGLLIDLDGVVWVGREPVAGRSRRWARCSGAAGRSASSPTTPASPPRVRGATGRGGVASAGGVVTAGEATARLAAESGGRMAALRDRRTGLPRALAAAGLSLLEGDAAARSRRGAGLRPPRLRLRGAADGDAGAATRRGAVRHQPRPDPADAGRRMAGTGAMLAAVETASGATAEIGGKPEPHLFEMARERIAGAERVAMVGDRSRPTSRAAGGPGWRRSWC